MKFLFKCFLDSGLSHRLPQPTCLSLTPVSHYFSHLGFLAFNVRGDPSSWFVLDPPGVSPESLMSQEACHFQANSLHELSSLDKSLLVL